MKLKTLLIFFLFMLVLAFPITAQARPPVPADVFKAVRTYWHTKTERVQAFDIIDCETGHAYNTTAKNGQYRGMFQMGTDERNKYGHGSTAMLQAKAAHKYYLISGWSPWRACL